MTKLMKKFGHRAFFEPIFPGAPRVCYSPSGDGDGGDDEAAAAAAAAELAAKEAEDAEKAAAEVEKEIEEAEGGADLKALSAEKAKLVREVMDKKQKLRDAEKRAEQALERLKAYEGIDPDKVRELIKKEADAEKAAAEAKGDFDRVKAMMVEEHQKQLETLRTANEELKAAREKDAQLISNLTVGNDFSGSRFIREQLTLTPTKARALYGSHFEIQDGRTVAFDKPAGSGERTMLVDASGEPLPFDEAFKRIIDADPDKDTLLRAGVTPGGGSKTIPVNKEREKNDKDHLFGASRIAASIATDI